MNNYPFQGPPCFSFPLSKRSQKAISTPQGPGSYEIPAIKSRAANFAKYSQRKDTTLTLDLPWYDTSKGTLSSSRVCKISQSHRVQKPINTPGPGSYNFDLDKDTRGGTIRMANPISDKAFGPGVGKYHLRGSLTQKCSIVYTLTSNPVKKRSTPGPGSYSIPSSGTTPISILKTNRTFSYLKKQDTPGPGAYHKETPKKIFHSRVVSMPVIKKDQTKQNFLSIEDLDRVAKFKKLQLSFAKQVRKNEFLNLQVCSPGPAMYKQIMTERKPLKFPQAKRPETFKPKEGPGVGSYNTGRTFGKDYKVKTKQKTIISNFANLEIIV